MWNSYLVGLLKAIASALRTYLIAHNAARSYTSCTMVMVPATVARLTLNQLLGLFESFCLNMFCGHSGSYGIRNKQGNRTLLILQNVARLRVLYPDEYELHVIVNVR
jgi:hypothetical protein